MIKASVYLGVPPWELQKQPLCWQAWSLEVQSSDNWAQSQMDKRNAARHKAFMEAGLDQQTMSQLSR